VSCIFAFAFDGINSTLGVFMVQKFSVQPWEIGALFVVTGIITAVTQAVFVAPVVKRYGEKTMTIASMSAQGLSSVFVYGVPAFWMLYPIGLLRNGVGGFIWATLGSLMAGKVEPREQGALAGANTALQSLMAALGPLVAGAAYDHIAPGAPFYLTALLFGLGALLIVGVRAPSQQQQRAEAVA
jgi:DHA1 family tetracycline resistance protein-like MFS transporter